jgi:hypothetical protein
MTKLEQLSDSRFLVSLDNGGKYPVLLVTERETSNSKRVTFLGQAMVGDELGVTVEKFWSWMDGAVAESKQQLIEQASIQV